MQLALVTIQPFKELHSAGCRGNTWDEKQEDFVNYTVQKCFKICRVKLYIQSRRTSINLVIFYHKVKLDAKYK